MLYAAQLGLQFLSKTVDKSGRERPPHSSNMLSGCDNQLTVCPVSGRVRWSEISLEISFRFWSEAPWAIPAVVKPTVTYLRSLISESPKTSYGLSMMFLEPD
jgi:hypothetical protein